MVWIDVLVAISVFSSLLRYSVAYRQQVDKLDYLIATPFAPQQQGDALTYTSKRGGGYLETVVTPLQGTLTLLELKGIQKFTQTMNPDFIDYTSRIKDKESVQMTVNCSGPCTYIIRVVEKQSYARPILHRLLASMPQDDTIGLDTLYTGVVSKYFQILAPPGSDPLFLRAVPYNGWISVHIRRCPSVNYFDCMEYETNFGFSQSEERSHQFIAKQKKRHGVTIKPSSKMKDASVSDRDKDILISRNDAMECSYIIRVQAKKENKYASIITRFRLMYWYGEE